MISQNELLVHVKHDEINKLDSVIKMNLAILLQKINLIRSAYGKPMIVNSGLRSMKHHLEIYRRMIPPPPKVPMGSKHLFGLAVDISDPQHELQKWCLKNINILEKTGLWMEEFSYTPSWCHFQIVPPKSGKRFFIPW